jgi:hypothetical protein
VHKSIACVYTSRCLYSGWFMRVETQVKHGLFNWSRSCCNVFSVTLLSNFGWWCMMDDSLLLNRYVVVVRVIRICNYKELYIMCCVFFSSCNLREICVYVLYIIIVCGIWYSQYLCIMLSLFSATLYAYYICRY